MFPHSLSPSGLHHMLQQTCHMSNVTCLSSWLHRCAVTFPAVVSRPTGSAGTPPAHRVTASVVLADTLHLTPLTKTPTRTCCRTQERKVPVVGNWYSGKPCCDGSRPKAALTHSNSSAQIRLPQLLHCLTRYYGNQAAHRTDSYCSDTIFP